MATIFDDIPETLFIDNVLYMAVNHTMLKSVVGVRYPWGVTIAKSNITLSTCGTGGSMVAGRYKICAVPENMLGHKGNPYKTDANFIPLTVYTAAHTTSASSVKITISIPKHPDPQVDTWLIYRTRVDELGPYFYVGSVDNGTSSYELTGNDDTLATEDFLEGPYSDDDSTLAGPFIYGRPPVASYIANVFSDTVFCCGCKPYTKGIATATVGSNVVTFSDRVLSTDATKSGLDVKTIAKVVTPDVNNRFIGWRFKFDDSPYAYTIAKVFSNNTVELNTEFLPPNSESTGDTVSGTFTLVGNQNMVYPSRPGEPEYFCPAEQFEVGQSTNTTIRGLIGFASDALIFTEQTIYRVTQGTYPGTYEVFETQSAYGTIAHKSVCYTPRGIAFFTGDHICIYNNQVSTPISLPLGDLLKNATPDLKQHTICRMVDNRLYVAFAAKDEVFLDTIAVFDMDTGTWDVWDGFQIVDMQKITSKKGQNRLYIEVPVGNDGYQAHFFTPDSWNDGLGWLNPSGTVDEADADTLTTTGVFPTYGTHGTDLRGLRIKIRTGVAEGEMRRIIANTATELTVGVPWTTIPQPGDTYTIGQIESNFRTGYLNYPDDQTEHVMKDMDMRISYIPVTIPS